VKHHKIPSFRFRTEHWKAQDFDKRKVMEEKEAKNIKAELI
jgi:hypothetical protein